MFVCLSKGCAAQARRCRMLGISVWPVPQKLIQSWKFSITRHLQELRSYIHFSGIPWLLIARKLLNYITVTTPSRIPEYFPEPFLQQLRTVSLTHCPLRRKLSPSVKFLSNAPDKHGEQNWLSCYQASCSEHTKWSLAFASACRLGRKIQKIFCPIRSDYLLGGSLSKQSKWANNRISRYKGASWTGLWSLNLRTHPPSLYLTQLLVTARSPRLRRSTLSLATVTVTRLHPIGLVNSR